MSGRRGDQWAATLRWELHDRLKRARECRVSRPDLRREHLIVALSYRRALRTWASPEVTVNRRT